ncbi:hypothetical protein AVEN_240721-1 [Araneus ventricosus]|uniref:Uncharacterized protein n=1 Tax=Araneus ventricosus TaxID=182803 RepID=A0A4Y2JSI3_ARAVE|nr:hypothetical protein AVEN_240721-1 [Araneus ventricosus]
MQVRDINYNNDKLTGDPRSAKILLLQSRSKVLRHFLIPQRERTLRDASFTTNSGGSYPTDPSLVKLSPYTLRKSHRETLRDHGLEDPSTSCETFVFRREKGRQFHDKQSVALIPLCLT